MLADYARKFTDWTQGPQAFKYGVTAQIAGLSSLALYATVSTGKKGEYSLWDKILLEFRDRSRKRGDDRSGLEESSNIPSPKDLAGTLVENHIPAGFLWDSTKVEVPFRGYPYGEGIWGSPYLVGVETNPGPGRKFSIAPVEHPLDAPHGPHWLEGDPSERRGITDAVYKTYFFPFGENRPLLPTSEWNQRAEKLGLTKDEGWGRVYRQLAWEKAVPAPLLVGVETNPGPRGNKNKKQNKQRQSNRPRRVRSNRSAASSRGVITSAPTNMFVEMGGPYYRFRGGRNGETMVLNGRQCVGSLVSNALGRGLVVRDGTGYWTTTFRPASSTVGTPLNTLAVQFQKWRYRAVRITYVPAISAATSGQFAMVFLKDPAQAVPTTTPVTAYNAIIGAEGACTTALWKPCSVSFRPDSDEWYFTVQPGVSAPDARTAAQFALAVALQGDYTATIPAGTTLGSFWMDYVVEFEDLTGLQTNQVALESEHDTIITPDGVISSEDFKSTPEARDPRRSTPADNSQLSGASERRGSTSSSYFDVSSEGDGRIPRGQPLNQRMR